MDGENNGKPYLLMDDLGGKPTIFGNTPIEGIVDPSRSNRIESVPIPSSRAGFLGLIPFSGHTWILKVGDCFNYIYFHPWGMIQIYEHIFSNGFFNHLDPDNDGNPLILAIFWPIWIH